MGFENFSSKILYINHVHLIVEVKKMLEAIWGLLVLLSVIWVIYDVVTQNKRLSDVMKVVWILVALVFGILGAAVYYFVGRK